jgi:hypothetical protein
MKKIFFSLACYLLTTVAFSQKAEWKEMNDFHKVMGGTFHPAEENKLQPLKDNATELVLKAKTWQSSAVPAGFNAAATKPILKKLVKQCKGIEKSVKKNKSDADLKSMITAAHDTFHEIMEKCRDEQH